MIHRQPNTEYVLSLSYGKDSIACLEAIKLLGYPLDRIVHAEVWATDTIPADLPPMVEFKRKADQMILDRYGIRVEHYCAMRAVERERERERVTYENTFYRSMYSKKYGREQIYGFPTTKGAWCNSRLKMAALARIKKRDFRDDVLPCAQTTGREYEDIRVPDFSDTRELVYQSENPCFWIAPHGAQT